MPSNSRTSCTSQWLIDMTTESKSKLNKLGAARTRIPRVADRLRRNEKHAKLFDPAIVAIGPYHRNKPHLSAMEDHKKAAAAAFAGPNMDAFRRVMEIVGLCRDCYKDCLHPPMNDEEFGLMLFFDGCFVLEFINRFMAKDWKDFTVSAHLHGLILRDIFLLENQLPYLLLETLMMEVKRVRIDEFLDRVAGTQHQRRDGPHRQEGPHRHLLERLREWELGTADETSQLERGSSGQSFRSAKELIEDGVKIRRGKTSFLRDVKFEQGLIRGELSLPLLVVDELTQTRLLNMIALEMSVGEAGCGGGDYGVTSFAWFMDLLIYSADDVKELRRAGVLQNLLGSDRQLAALFNDIAKDLVPDQQAYGDVIKSINTYYNRKCGVCLYRGVRANLELILVLTVVATVFTVIQTFYTIYPPTV